MIDTDTLLGDDELRLLDVLLEEEVSSTASPQLAIAPADAARTWPLAVAVLLGVAVVVMASWLATGRGDDTRSASPQDPVPKSLEVVPFDAAKLASVTAVRLRAAREVDYWTLRYRGDARDCTEIRDPTSVASWREALGGSLRASDWNGARGYLLELDLGNGTMMAGRVDAYGSCMFANQGFVADRKLRTLLAEGIEDVRRNGRRARGVAASLAELRQLDPATRAIVAPWLTATEARRELKHFPDLESIEFAPGACTASRADANVPARSVPGNDLALALAQCRKLRHVALLAGFLHADGLRALDSLPQLRSLVITGDPSSVPGDELGALAQRLEVLRVPDRALTSEQLRAISGSTTLRELWLVQGDPPAATADCVRALPALRKLSVSGARRDGHDVIAAIARTRIVELQLVAMTIDDDGLDQLGDLPTLRTLILHEAKTASLDLPRLGALRQLHHLYTDTAPRPWRDAAQADLPDCDLHPEPWRGSWVSPFAPRQLWHPAAGWRPTSSASDYQPQPQQRQRRNTSPAPGSGASRQPRRVQRIRSTR